ELRTRIPDMSIVSGAQFVLIIPRRYFESVGGFEGFSQRPIGSGPYEVAEYIRDDRVVFRKRAARHPFRNAQADELIVRAIPENAQRINGLRTGEVDIIAPAALTTDQIQQAEQAGFQFQIIRNAFIFLSIPQGTAELRNTPLRDRRVRLALSYAIDRDAISRTLYRNYAQPLGQLALEGSQSWDPSARPVFDPQRARQLLAEAGYPNGIRQSFTVEMSRAQNLQDLLLAIQQMFRDIGVTMELEIIDGTLYGDRAYGRNNQQKSDLVTSGNGDTNGFYTAMRVLYGCGRPLGSPPAALFYCNPEWDRLLDQALSERDATRRAELYRQANRIFREDAWVIPLFAPASFLVYSPKIQGLDVSGRTQFNFDDAFKIR
ncbi:MAG: ABC transporter substrate-binding protein, partial [Dehalococcoidia bacterium]|nr:ABC transporter substrate-binding protein [Dehalococcoidia bacterium]